MIDNTLRISNQRFALELIKKSFNNKIMNKKKICSIFFLSLYNQNDLKTQTTSAQVSNQLKKKKIHDKTIKMNKMKLI